MEPAIEEIAARNARREGGLLPCLLEIQARIGCVPNEALSDIAAAFSLSTAEVHGVVSFYHDLRSSPAAQRVVQICCAESCQAVGARELAAEACQALGVDFGQNHASGTFRLERVYCLGNCACGPSIRIDDAVYGRVDARGLSDLVAGAMG